MPEKSTNEITLPVDILKPEDFELDRGSGNLTIKNDRIAEVLKSNIDLVKPGADTAAVKVSVGVDF